MRLQLEAAGLAVGIAGDHPNKMAISGVLARLDQPSDAAPHGADGKRIVLTKAAAQRALHTLPGMGINLSATGACHDQASKVGVISGAHIDGNAVEIEGWLWHLDSPAAALRILAGQSGLGFSFEAQAVAVENPHADPLVITALVFTGASVLARSAAAYRSTALSVVMAMGKENVPVSDALKLAAGAAGKFVDARLAAAGDHLAVPTKLHRVMAAAGVEAPGDRGVLSEQQLDRILEGKRIEDRMRIRGEIFAAGYYPRTLPTFSSMPRMR